MASEITGNWIILTVFFLIKIKAISKSYISGPWWEKSIGHGVTIKTEYKIRGMDLVAVTQDTLNIEPILHQTPIKCGNQLVYLSKH